MALDISYTSRNIGDVFYTLRSDSTLNGAVATDGAEYNAADFDQNEENNPYALCINNRLPNLPYADYANQVKTQGCCAYFGIDTANGKFKVPTINDVVIQAGDVSTLAKYLAPSFSGKSSVTVPISGWGVQGGGFNQGTAGTLMVASGIREINETLESLRLAGSNKTLSVNVSGTAVQPKALRLRPMIQLVTGSSVKDEEEGGGSTPSLKVPYIFVPGTEAKATEVNANFEYILRAIESKDTEPVVHLAGDETITGRKTFTNSVTAGGLELIPNSVSSHGGYVDFHFGGTTADYTARLIEAQKGYLSINQNPPSDDSSTKIATTNWVNSKLSSFGSSSGVASSWFKLSSGTIVQFGRTGLIGRRGSGTVTLPTKMPNALVSVQITPFSWSGSTNGDKGSLTWVADSYAVNSFRILNRHEQCSISFSWVAIGY